MAHGMADGHDKEPKSFFGGRSDGGRGMPAIHSHKKGGMKKRMAGTEHRHVGKRLGMKVHGKGK